MTPGVGITLTPGESIIITALGSRPPAPPGGGGRQLPPGRTPREQTAWGLVVRIVMQFGWMSDSLSPADFERRLDRWCITYKASHELSPTPTAIRKAVSVVRRAKLCGVPLVDSRGTRSRLQVERACKGIKLPRKKTRRHK